MRLACSLVSVLFLGACTADKSGNDGLPPTPVVVYASTAQEATLEEAFSQFTAATGIPVMLKVSDGGSNIRAVIEDSGTPPADVLITATVTDIWRAADEGALRPLTSIEFEKLPSVLKDPDHAWAAIGVRYARIVVSTAAEAGLVNDYSDLAKSELRGKICLSSSSLPINRTLVAMLIEDLGIKPAERLIRAWIRNLAASPYTTEAKLVEGLRSGTCEYGIVSSFHDVEGFSTVSPDPLYLDIDGIGVARHAAQAESAQALVQWMLAANSLPEPQSSNGRNLALAGWREEDARLLVERAGYR